MRNSSRGVTQWWVGVVGAIVAERPWTTLWFIVMWPLSYGVWYSGCLGFGRYYQRRFLIDYVGGRVGDLIQISRTLHPYLWRGLYGGKEISLLLKMWSARQSNCKYLSLVLFMSGLLYQVSQIVTLFIPS